jgi:hypothetical protein
VPRGSADQSAAASPFVLLVEVAAHGSDVLTSNLLPLLNIDEPLYFDRSGWRRSYVMERLFKAFSDTRRGYTWSLADQLLQPSPAILQFAAYFRIAVAVERQLADDISPILSVFGAFLDAPRCEWELLTDFLKILERADDLTPHYSQPFRFGEWIVSARRLVKQPFRRSDCDTALKE